MNIKIKLILFLWLLFCWPSFAQPQPLRVAVAANAQFVMEKLSAAFVQKTGIVVEPIISSSGKLTTQIQQGAPFDVFLSADMTYPETLYQQGYTTAAPVVYAYGSLVVWTLSDLPLSPDLKILLNPAIRHIAIANPTVAPYGEAAISVLKMNKLLEKIQPKIVYGESISQVNQYLLSGAAEVSFTAKSVVLDPSLSQRGQWIDLPQSAYRPIAQGVVIIKRTTQPKAAQQFVAFLQSREARQIFKTFGYRVSVSPAIVSAGR
jgi:molybdate transport system substrate-binding protein